MASEHDQYPAGPATDFQGRPVRDPSPNVLDLVDAAIQRQDDLRKAEFKRQDDLRAMEAKYQRKIADLQHDYESERANLRHSYEGELRKGEAERLNSIRSVDQAARQRETDVSAQQAATLAAQVVATADAFRATLGSALDPIIKDIADLRRVQYEQVGQRSQVSEARLNLGAVLGGLSVLLVLIFGIVGLVITSR
jgi:transketolase